MSSKSEAPEIINLDENDLEVSFKIDSVESRTPKKGNPIADSVKNDSEIQAIFDVVITYSYFFQLNYYLLWKFGNLVSYFVK